ncbi:SBBP repeat-containing protein [Acidobacteria bacterium AH-259-O06]|nr:SBBP repeat-containing protein [Acidobacteria bacterium AH-259-O06]
MNCRQFLPAWILALLLLANVSGLAINEAHKKSIVGAYGRIPLHFEANQGQTDPRVKFLSRGRGYTLFLTPTGAVLTLRKPMKPAAGNKRPALGARIKDEDSKLSLQTATVRMRLIGANPNPAVKGLEELPGKVNYFIGQDPERWRTGISTYAKVRYEEVYPGVDLIYYGNQAKLEYDFVVAPGADLGVITLRFESSINSPLQLDSQGHLVLTSEGGELRLRKPFIYQESDGRREEIGGEYVLRDSDYVGFEVGAYDRSKALIIDPVLEYSTYLGGSGDDQGWAIAVDAAGSAYVTGWTQSPDFPTANPLQPIFGGGSDDAFVTKLNASGSALVYSTYLGGSRFDEGRGIAVDAAGSAYVTGETFSSDFPTANALQTVYGGSGDAFVAKLDSTGAALVYSTYLGGSSFERGFAIAVDAAGSAYVTGETRSSDFPTANALQPDCNPRSVLCSDVFVTKLNASGSALAYSTYLGGSSYRIEKGLGIAVDDTGSAYVTGETGSSDFPTANALQPIFGGGSTDAFVTKLNASGSALVYCTYLGGSGGEAGEGIAVDAAGSAFVIGETSSTDFPIVNAFQPTFGGSIAQVGIRGDAFVTKLNASGSALVYSTYLGGSGREEGLGIAVDAAGSAYLTGTGSLDFPIVDALPEVLGGAFVTKLDATGSVLVYSTHLGGSAKGIAVDAAGSAYLTGWTFSTDFPTTPGAFDRTCGTDGNCNSDALGFLRIDAFIAKIAETGCTYAISPTTQSFEAEGGTGSVRVTAPSGCNWTVVSNASWITITSGSSGSGNGTVTYSVAANTSTSLRTDTLTIAGQTFTVTQEASRVPVVIIPGFPGSVLYDDKNNNARMDSGERIWPPLTGFRFGVEVFGLGLPPGDPLPELRLKGDGETPGDANVEIRVGSIVRGITFANCGIRNLCELVVPGKGGHGEHINVYPPLIQFLEGNLRYTEGLIEETLAGQPQVVESGDLFTFPYDWRKDLRGAAQRLDQWVDVILEETGSEKVILISHSTGGLVARYYATVVGSSKVDKLIQMGTPNLGGLVPYFALRFGLPRISFIKFFGEAEDLRILMRNWRSLYQLLPTEEYTKGHSLIKIQEKEGTLYNLIQTLQEIWPDQDTKIEVTRHWGNAIRFWEELGAWDRPGTIGVPTFTIASNGLKTPEGIRIVRFYKQSIIKPQLVEVISVERTNGDGLFTITSQHGGALDGNVTPLTVSDVDHGVVPTDPRVHNAIKDIINGVPPTLLQFSVPKADSKVLLQSDPLELHVFDSAGFHNGPVKSGGAEVSIPGSEYLIMENTTNVFLPNENVYKMEIRSTGEERTFNFEVHQEDTEGTVTRSAFYDGQMGPQSVGELTYDPASPAFPDLNLDLEGDGTFETTLSPTTALSRSQLGEKKLYFAQFGNGQGFTSDIVLTNPSATETVSGKVDFFDDNGLALPVGIAAGGNDGVPPATEVLASAVQSGVEFSIPPLGAVSISTDGQGELAAGSAAVTSDNALGGVIRFSIPGIGIAGVGASQLVDTAIIPIVRELATGLSTGLALVNAGAETTLTLTLKGLDGTTVAKTEIEVPSKGHIARFVHEIFAQIGDFEGTLVVEGGPLVATALQLGPNPGEFTTLPVIPVAPQPWAGTLHYAQFGNGDGLVSSVFLLNPSLFQRAKGNLAFFDDNGNGLLTAVNGMAPASNIGFNIAPHGGAIFTTDGRGPVVVGSARVTSAEGVQGGVLRFALPAVGIAGVGTSGSFDGFISPVRQSTATGLRTGVAISSTGTAVTLNLVLRNANGQALAGGETAIDLAANGHTARFIDELFPSADTGEFQGTLTVTAEGGEIATTALELGTQPGQFTTLPVTPLH